MADQQILLDHRPRLVCTFSLSVTKTAPSPAGVWQAGTSLGRNEGDLAGLRDPDVPDSTKHIRQLATTD